MPIWHQISTAEIQEYSPTLADRIAVNTAEGLDDVVAEINRVTQFISSDDIQDGQKEPSTRADARRILDRIVPAGPVQPDDGLKPPAIGVVKELVDLWEEEGELHFLAKVEKMSYERRKILYNDERHVILFPTRGMHQVRIEVIDLSYKSIGMLWTPPKISDNDYHRALEFFLNEMGFLDDEILKVEVLPMINSDDAFWVVIR